jgi:NAD(P)H-flavin reductase
MQAITDKTSLHSVYVVDEDGMSKIFTELKQMLASQSDNHTTLIYFSPENNFIFDRELEILQKRYPTQFILYPVREKVIDASRTLQEILEAVINSNTKDRLIFILSGDEELSHILSNQLWFLGICKNQIKIYFLE